MINEYVTFGNRFLSDVPPENSSLPGWDPFLTELITSRIKFDGESFYGFFLPPGKNLFKAL